MSEDEVEEISHLEYFKSRMKTSGMSRTQKKDTHKWLQKIAETFKLKYEDEDCESYKSHQ